MEPGVCRSLGFASVGEEAGQGFCSGEMQIFSRSLLRALELDIMEQAPNCPERLTWEGGLLEGSGDLVSRL